MPIRYPDLIRPQDNFAVLYKKYPTYNIFAVLNKSKKARLTLIRRNEPNNEVFFIESNSIYYTCEGANNAGIKKEGEYALCQDMLSKEA